jgi:hypothetical protein
MTRRGNVLAMVLSSVVMAFVSLVAAADDATPLLPRNTVVPLSAVTEYFPDVTTEAGTGPNETSVGKPVAALSVIFTSADGKKKVTLSIDQYATADDAAAAYKTAVDGSVTAPGFKPADSPNLGQEAFAGSSQVGDEMHFGLGARDGNLIMSATHAGGIPVTPDNSNNLATLGGMTPWEAISRPCGVRRVHSISSAPPAALAPTLPGRKRLPRRFAGIG